MINMFMFSHNQVNTKLIFFFSKKKNFVPSSASHFPNPTICMFINHTAYVIILSQDIIAFIFIGKNNPFLLFSKYCIFSALLERRSHVLVIVKFVLYIKGKTKFMFQKHFSHPCYFYVFSVHDTNCLISICY